jgi:predicted thioesterase
MDCAAIIQIENSSPHELAGAFLDLDVLVGTVVVNSSVSHLGRGGIAAFAGDVVKAASRIREVYGRAWW